MMRSVSVISLISLFAVGLANPAPAPTPKPDLLAPRAATEIWDYATTSIHIDERFMGVVRVKNPVGLWYLHCIDAALTTVSGYAGCGTYDLYTKCAGQYAYGLDGNDIRCGSAGSGFKCVTHSIFENAEAYESSSFTPFIGCGKTTVTLEMIRYYPASWEVTTGDFTPTGIVTGESTSSPGTIGSINTTTSSSGLSKGAIAGVAVGGVVAGIIIFAVAMFFVRRARKARDARSASLPEAPDSPQVDYSYPQVVEKKSYAHQAELPISPPSELDSRPVAELR